MVTGRIELRKYYRAISGKAFNKVYINECFHSNGKRAESRFRVPEAFILESYDMRHRW